MVLIKTAAVILGVVLAALSALQAEARDPDEEDGTSPDKGKVAVQAWIDRTLASDSKGAAPSRVPRKVEAVDTPALRSAFPEEKFYSIHFKKMPRPDMSPKSFQTAALVRARADGSVDRIDDLDALKRLLAGKFTCVRDDAQAREALSVSLRLAEAYYQDGELTFTVPEESVSVSREGERRVVTGRGVVARGGKGEVRASLNFGPSGSLNADDIQISGRVRSDSPLR